MELFHTSNGEIKSINKSGRFGSFLFFSCSPYAVGKYTHIYKINVDENDIIDADRLFYHEDAAALDSLVHEVMEMAGVDEDTAEDLISQKKDVFGLDELGHMDGSELADMSWDIQHITARAAVMLGFRGAAMLDEQGTCYLIDMLGRESELRVTD